MSLFRKIIAGVITVGIMLSAVACGSDTSNAAIIDGMNIKAGIYIYYLQNAISDAQQIAGKEDIWGIDIEDKPAKEWIKDKATEYCKNYVGILRKFDELELSLSSDDKSMINNQVQSIWETYAKSFEEVGISEQSYNDIAKSDYMYKLIFDKLYGKGGINAVDDEELMTYLDDEFIRYKSISIPLKDGSGDIIKSEDRADIKDLANDYLDRAKAGEDFDKLIDEYAEHREEEVEKANPTTTTETSDTQAAEDSADDDDDDEEEDIYAKESILKKDSKAHPTKVMEFLNSDLKIGEPTFFEGDEYYYIFLRLDMKERSDYLAENRAKILEVYKGDELKGILEDFSKDYTVEKNDKAYDRYDPEDIAM
ncbi:MAG: hypothetical protein GX967_04975 [Clostridiales bacterium]|nr:hypothetical protein [Clostridiales bacterium]